MNLDVWRYHRQDDDKRTLFELRFSVALDSDEGLLAYRYGTPYLKAFWERRDHGPFDIDAVVGKRLIRQFKNIEDAKLYERELIDSCQADLWNWQQAEAWPKEKDGTVQLQPQPYPEDRTSSGTGT